MCERPHAFPIGGGNRCLFQIRTAASFPAGFVTNGIEKMCVDHRYGDQLTQEQADFATLNWPTFDHLIWPTPGS